MNNIVCVKWGNLYGPEYVNILYAMVKRNMTLPFRFICFTDDTTGIHADVETKPLLNKTLKGWWSKIEYFKSPLDDIEGPTLAIDLDVYIVNNIDDFFTFEPNEFCMKWDYAGHGHSSCVMRFNAGQYPNIYDNLDLNNIDHAIHNTVAGFKNHKYWGDQMWITEQLKNEPVKLWPKEWIPKFAIDCHREKISKKPYASIPRPQRKAGEFFIPDDAKIGVLAGAQQRNEKLLDKLGEFWHMDDIDK